jgi:ribonuclease HI
MLNTKHAIPSLGSLPGKEILATAAWFIWWRRREMKHQGEAPPPSRIALSIKAMVANALKVKKNKSARIKMGWSKPPAGFMKLNTDAAVNVETRRASTGCVIRDASGQFVAACRNEIDGVIDVTTAEAQAVRDGLRLAERAGCTRIYVETDSMNVVTAFEDPTSNRIVGMAYLDECRTIMAGFASTRLTHCPREANQAADLIAKSVDVSNSKFWLEEPPLFLVSQLVEDVTFFV